MSLRTVFEALTIAAFAAALKRICLTKMSSAEFAFRNGKAFEDEASSLLDLRRDGGQHWGSSFPRYTENRIEKLWPSKRALLERHLHEHPGKQKNGLPLLESAILCLGCSPLPRRGYGSCTNWIRRAPPIT